MTDDPDEMRERAAAARPGLEDEAAHLRREGPTLGRHRVLPKTLAEALHYPGAEDVEFDPPKASGKPS